MKSTDMGSWRQMLDRELKDHGETADDVISCTLSGEEMAVEFDTDFGGTNGQPFTVWTEKRVYFPTEYDGAEGVASVSRHPDGKPTEHI